MDKLGTILPGVLQKRGLKDHAQASVVVHLAELWIEKHLPHISASLHAVTLRDGSSLILESTNSIAAQEMMPHLDPLLRYLKSEAPQHALREIRVIRERSKQ